MARQGERQILRLDSVPIILDPDQGFAAIGDGDVDPARPGIDCVLDQFLDGRGWPLDHLTCRNAIHRCFIKLVNSGGFLAYIGVGSVHDTKASMPVGRSSMPRRQVSVDKKTPVSNPATTCYPKRIPARSTDLANSRAILLMTAAMAAFAVTDALIKIAAGEIGAMQCLMLISLLSLAGFLPVLWTAGDRLLSPQAVSRPMLVRTAGEIVGSTGIVGGLALVPLSTVTALMQVQPLLLTAAAAVFLGERVGWRRWAAVSAGFVGMVIILRPGLAAFDPLLLLPLMGVAGLTARDIGTRLLPSEVSTAFAASWALLSLSLVGAVGTFAGSGWKPMTGTTPFVVLAAAVSVSAAYVLITLALRTGEVSAVAPFRYTRILFALALAWVVFEERPDVAVWLGLFIIVASGLYAFWREGQVGGKNDVSA